MSQIRVNIGDNVIREAEDVLGEMGTSLSTAISIYLETIACEHRIPFVVTSDPFYCKENIHYLEQKKRECDEGKLKTAEHSLIED